MFDPHVNFRGGGSNDPPDPTVPAPLLTRSGDSAVWIGVVETMLFDASRQVDLVQVGGVVVCPAGGVGSLVLVDVDSDTAR